MKGAVDGRVRRAPHHLHQRRDSATGRRPSWALLPVGAEIERRCIVLWRRRRQGPTTQNRGPAAPPTKRYAEQLEQLEVMCRQSDCSGRVRREADGRGLGRTTGSLWTASGRRSPLPVASSLAAMCASTSAWTSARNSGRYVLEVRDDALWKRSSTSPGVILSSSAAVQTLRAMIRLCSGGVTPPEPWCNGQQPRLSGARFGGRCHHATTDQPADRRGRRLVR